MKLLRYGRSVDTVFDLLGHWEDDMTYPLGFVASRSAFFAQGLAKVVGGVLDCDDVGPDPVVTGLSHSPVTL